MDCLVCERLRNERDRKDLAYRMALNTIRDNPGGDAAQRLLLQAMAREAKIDLDIAEMEIASHQDHHGIPYLIRRAGTSD